MVTEQAINAATTRLEVMNLVSDACRYYSFSAGDSFDLSTEIEVIEKLDNNNCETEIILNLFKAAQKKIQKLTKRVKNDS